MAINTRKISGLHELNSLTGNEYLMIANAGKSYKIRTSLLTSDIITKIEQDLVEGDEAESPITITTSAGYEYTFTIRNGRRGSQGLKGETGEKGETGNSGVALYNNTLESVIGLIIDSLNDKEHTDKQLSSMILSAKQGAILNTKLDKLKEVYCTQTQYDAWVEEDENRGSEAGYIKKIDAGTKYFIVEEE